MANNQRYTLSLPTEISEQLTQMSKKSKITKSNILRNAVGLYLFLYKEVREENHKIILRSQKDNETKDRELLFEGVL